MKVCLISTSTFPSDQGLRTLSACLERAGHEVLMIFLPLVEDYMRRYTSRELKEIFEKAKDSVYELQDEIEDSLSGGETLKEISEKLEVQLIVGKSLDSKGFNSDGSINELN